MANPATSRTRAARAPARRAAPPAAAQPEPVARAIRSSLDKLDGSRAIGFLEAFQEMERGAVVRRITAEGETARFHRLFQGEVQTADTEQALVDGRWTRSKTDIAAFYGSTFRLVRVKYQMVELTYG